MRHDPVESKSPQEPEGSAHEAELVALRATPADALALDAATARSRTVTRPFSLQRIAILLDSFPELSQTFINNQILSLLELGIEVTILSFGRGVAGQPQGSTLQILARANVAYLRVPRSIWWFWLDVAFLAAHARSTLSATLRALRRGWKPTRYDS